MSRKRCRACREREWEFKGDKPKCAFLTGKFSSENWNCATMNELRDLAEDHGYRDRKDDCSIGVLYLFECEHIVMTWYKERGCTSDAMVVSDGERRELLLKDAERCIAFFARTTSPAEE